MFAATALALVVGVATARADGPVGSDPPSNFTLGKLPSACRTAPEGTRCEDAVISRLDAARASLGQPPYDLPADFTSLTQPEQAFVLTDLDRVLYGLPPITGLTAALDADAAGGVQADDDPRSSDPSFDYYTSNWAGGYPNMPAAYEGWMYNDGPGSGNLDCTSGDPSGCWGHRHDILWSFGGDGTLAMGAAIGQDPSGTPGQAMLLGEGHSGYVPDYTYTWAQAQADGAGAGSGDSTASVPPASLAPASAAPVSAAPTSAAPVSAAPASAPPVSPSLGRAAVDHPLSIAQVRIAKNRVRVSLTASVSGRLRCALSRRLRHGWTRAQSRSCGTTVVYRGLRGGRYRFSVRAGAARASREFTLKARRA